MQLLTLTDDFLWVVAIERDPVVVRSNKNTVVCSSWFTVRPVAVLYVN